MKLPGFTAEKALGKPSKVYWSPPLANSALGSRWPGIVPAQAETYHAEADEMEDEAEQHAGENADDDNETGSEHDDSDADGSVDAGDDSDESDGVEGAEG